MRHRAWSLEGLGVGGWVQRVQASNASRPATCQAAIRVHRGRRPPGCILVSRERTLARFNSRREVCADLCSDSAGRPERVGARSGLWAGHAYSTGGVTGEQRV